MNTKNHILLKVMDGSPHLRHILTSEKVKRMCLYENRYPFVKLPVCSGCERLGLWTKAPQGHKRCYCEVCGTYTLDPRTYAEYLSNGEDLDPHGKTFRELSVKMKTDLGKNRILYIPER